MDPADAVGLLLAEGLIAPGDVLCNQFAVAPVGGRNHALLVETAEAGILCKRVATRDHWSKEMTGLSLGAAALAGSTDGWVPTAVPVSEGDGALVVSESPAGLAPMGEGRHRGRYRRWMLRALGRTLALVHSSPIDDDAPLSEMLPINPEGAPTAAMDESSAVLRVLTHLYADTQLVCAIRQLAEASSARGAFVHGDIRAANVLAPASPSGGRGIWLVDWESSGRGDPALDVGAALAVVLGLSLRRSTDGPDRSGVRIVLDAYRTAGGKPDLMRALRRTGASLIQSAVEDAAGGDAVSSYARRAIEVGRMALTSPELFAVHLRLL